MTTHHRLVLDREGDPTALLEIEWTFHDAEPGSIALVQGWSMDRITATDADTGTPIELDEKELEYVQNQYQPEYWRTE